MDPNLDCTLDQRHDISASEAPLPALPLGACLRRWAADHAQRTALVDRTGRHTYAALDRRVDRLAAALHGAGLRRGDRAMVQLPNGVGFVTVCFALFRLGAVPVMAMPTQRAHDIHALCRIAEPTAYFIADRFAGFDYRPLADEILQAHPSLRLVVVDGSVGDRAGPFTPLAALDAAAVPLAQPLVTDTALLLLSGGTTGTPKLIPRTHADYGYNFMASARLCGLDRDSVYMAVLPAAHNFALACPGVLGALAQGGTILLSDTASCDEAMPLIAAERVTHLALVPPLAQLWVDAREWEDSDLSSLRLIQVGGARLEAPLARRMIETLGAPLQQVFGMAEGLICYTRPDDPAETVLHTQGRPLSPLDEIRIVDELDQDVPAGEAGELLTRGPYTIRGYYRAPEQNALSFTVDGYYRTGDIVRQDPAGNLIVEGRLKEQVNRAGEKVSAAEVEGLLKTCPGVEDAVVVPVPDPLLGERICAFVRPATASKTEIKAQLRSKGLSDFKLPDQIETIDYWPLTPVGKIDKQRLIALAADKGRPVRRRYADKLVPVRSGPLDLAVRIVRKLSQDRFTLYERDGEWSIGIGDALSLAVQPDGEVVRSDGRRWNAPKVCSAVAEAIADVPFEAWRAYGRAKFEFCYLIYGVEDGQGQEPLLQLSIPESEIRLTEGTALVRSLDTETLVRLAALVEREDAASAAPDGDPLLVASGAGAEQSYKTKVASAVREMQAEKYQKVILSRTVEAPASLDMAASYLCGRRANTPARSFFLNDGEFTAFGFSPETVAEVSAAGEVSTQPLAGTRALTGDPVEDARLERELLRDAKEIAEHAVSVKLAMEELSGVCSDDSLGVSEFMSVYKRGAVQHLASRVCGRLREGRSAWDAFEKLFPAVTASGIPKREALDSIRRHEQQPRGLYSGCVMVVEESGAMDAALVLRSVYRDGGRCWLQAGAGLVPLSTPEREWTETCEKLASVARHLRARRSDGVAP